MTCTQPILFKTQHLNRKEPYAAHQSIFTQTPFVTFSYGTCQRKHIRTRTHTHRHARACMHTSIHTRTHRSTLHTLMGAGPPNQESVSTSELCGVRSPTIPAPPAAEGTEDSLPKAPEACACVCVCMYLCEGSECVSAVVCVGVPMHTGPLCACMYLCEGSVCNVCTCICVCVCVTYEHMSPCACVCKDKLSLEQPEAH
jgi:hypothetical protein